MREMRDVAPEQRIKLVKSTGRANASNSPAGSERHTLSVRINSRGLSVDVGSGDGNLIIAIVAILASAALILAFILT